MLRVGVGAFSLLLIAALCSGGLAHSFIEHDHGGPQADLMHAIALGSYLFVFLVISLIFFGVFGRAAILQIALRQVTRAPDPFHKALREGAIASSVYR
jgi:hypothetical protein